MVWATGDMLHNSMCGTEYKGLDLGLVFIKHMIAEAFA
jgi:hypothetical protein